MKGNVRVNSRRHWLAAVAALGLIAPAVAQPLWAGLATSDRVPSALAQLARTALLDSVYTEELDRQLSRRNDG